MPDDPLAGRPAYVDVCPACLCHILKVSGICAGLMLSYGKNS